MSPHDAMESEIAGLLAAAKTARRSRDLAGAAAALARARGLMVDAATERTGHRPAWAATLPNRQPEGAHGHLPPEALMTSYKRMQVLPKAPPMPVIERHGMTEADIRALLEGICPVIKEFVDEKVGGHAKVLEEAVGAMQRMAGRIDELESRLAVMESRAMRFEGTFSRALEYQRGATVVHGGSLWYAVADNSKQPPSDSWLLVAKGGTVQSSASLHAIDAKGAARVVRSHAGQIELSGAANSVVGRG